MLLILFVLHELKLRRLG